MMSKEASTKIVNFMSPGAGVPVIGCGPIKCMIIPPANEVAGVYSDPYIGPFVRPSVRPSVPPNL